MPQSSERCDDNELVIAGQEVMQAWERPLMERMAALVIRSGGDALEVWFGMGISADAMLRNRVRSYTAIECHPDVVRRTQARKGQYPSTDIRVVEGAWWDVIDELGSFDAIFFDTYPLDDEEFDDLESDVLSYIEAFFPKAVAHLRPGGVFTYFTGEIDSPSRRHQRSLFQHFSTVETGVFRALHPPADCTYWWADSMVTVAARA